MFATVTDIEEAAIFDFPPGGEDDKEQPLAVAQAAISQATIVPRSRLEPELIQEKRRKVIKSIASKLNVSLVQKSRALFWDPTHQTRVACAISKVYANAGHEGFWYAYHPQWAEYLAQGRTGLFVLGCMNVDEAYAIPRVRISAILPRLHTTTRNGSTYWHIRLQKTASGMVMLIPRQVPLPLQEFSLPLDR